MPYFAMEREMEVIMNQILSSCLGGCGRLEEKLRKWQMPEEDQHVIMKDRKGKMADEGCGA